MATSLDQLYDLILGDLTRADALLEVNKVFGCADKVAAESLMAKAYLTIASSKEHNVYRYTESRREPQIMYDSAARNSSTAIYTTRMEMRSRPTRSRATSRANTSIPTSSASEPAPDPI